MYDYKNAVREDVKEWITDNYDEEEIREKISDRDGWEEELNDTLWTADSVTGNGSGSYTFDREKAGEYLAGNFDELCDAIDDFGGDYEDVLRKGEEGCDVTIRCYYLSGAISDVLDELEEEYHPVEEEEDSEEE